MAILTNSKKFGATGAYQEDIASRLLHLEAALQAMCAKMDSDGGITDTDYQARFEQVIASGAAPIVTGFTMTTIAAEYDA